VDRSLFLLALIALGLVWGSFANVVIHRFPRGESVVRPASKCPGCGHEIRWYDNVPVLSWFLLRGACRDCGEPISARYPLVEALGGALWLAAGLRFGMSGKTLVAILFFHVLLVLTFIDLDTMRLPNPIVLALFGVGVVAVAMSVVTPWEFAPLVGSGGRGVLAEPLGSAAIGIGLGVLPSLGIALVYGAVRGRSGLGMGDVKLLGAMGPFLGPFTLFAFFGGSVLGTLVGIPVMARARARGAEAGTAKIPFGPFIAVAAVVAVLVGPSLVSWYAGLVGI
jgi:leader peptidase (prepilin peptidase)/N-methyltransferase